MKASEEGLLSTPDEELSAPLATTSNYLQSLQNKPENNFSKLQEGDGRPPLQENKSLCLRDGRTNTEERGHSVKQRHGERHDAALVAVWKLSPPNKKKNPSLLCYHQLPR